MSSSATFTARMIDQAIAIKRTLAIRSRLAASCEKYWLRAWKTRCGLELARDLILDRRYGGWCGGILQTPYPELQASRTQSTHYLQLIRLFREVPIKGSDVLVDVGCGKGRVINYWLHMGCKNRIVGIELNERVADRARERLKGYPNVSIVAGDVLEHIPEDATLFFLYHPFGETVMEQFRAALRRTVRNAPDLRIVYYNCVHRQIFDNDPDWEVAELTSRIVDQAVLVRPRWIETPGAPGSERSGPR